MKQYMALSPRELPEGFDATKHGEEPIISVEESKKKITITFAFPGFFISDDLRTVDGVNVKFHQLKIKGGGYTAVSGKPLMPSFGRYVNIPFTCDFKAGARASNPKVFDGVNVLPAQTQLTDSPNKHHAFEYDRAAYGSEQPYPKELLEVTGPFDINGYNAILIHVRPFQYTAAKKQLVGYSNVTVTINLIPVDGKTSAALPEDRNLMAFGNLFLNPRRDVGKRVGISTLPVTDARLVHPAKPVPQALEIIYYDNFKPAADKLSGWKNRKGIATKTTPISAIGNESGKIRKYIRSLHTPSSSLRYVLLLGDTDQVTPERKPGHVSDYYYSTLSDPTAANPLVYPWVAIGRIPVRTLNEATCVVDQIIAYEKTPPTDPGYYRRMVFAAYFQDDNMDGREDRAFLMTMESLCAYIGSLGYATERVYVSGNPNLQHYYDGTPIPSDIKASIMSGAAATSALIKATTKGQLMIAHRDHGYEEGWGDPAFTTANLNQVSGDICSLFYSINCMTGQYDYANNSKECFAEKNLRMRGTAPSIVAASDYSNTWLNNDLIKGLFDATFGGVIPTFPGGNASYAVKHNRLGDILNYAKSYLPVRMSQSTDEIRKEFEIYHVLGDPTLEIWTTAPRVVKLSAGIDKNLLTIRLSECPADSTVTICVGDKIVKRLSPTSANIVVPLDFTAFPLSVLSKTDIAICFYAPAYRYTEVKLRYPTLTKQKRKRGEKQQR